VIDHLELLISNLSRSHAFYEHAFAPLAPAHHPSYFAAFVLDPDQHLVELVCHTE
jgi:catechol 2,3-dioxygenase-like lactoylglutathione lyase family enzyme